MTSDASEVSTDERDRRFMRSALDQAREAKEVGEVPVGSVVVRDGEPISRGFNRRESWQDPAAHAEMIAMRRAARQLGSWRLEGCTVYVTLEPCPMCAGMLVNARVPRLVFGAPDPNAGAVRTLFEIAEDECLNHRVDVVEGILAEACGDILEDFFQAIREGRAEPKPTPSESEAADVFDRERNA